VPRIGPGGAGRTSEDAVWRDAIQLAINAPSVRNVQPWRFRLRRGVLELHLAPEASADAGDAALRTVTVSCGVVLHHLRVALRAAGETPVVELVRDPGPSALLAIVRLGEARVPTSEDRRLAGGIVSRHTQRAPFDARRLRGEFLDRLAVAAADEGGFLDVLRGARRDAVCRLLTGEDLLLARQAPALAVLSGAGDGVREQLEAGQALSAVVLEAAAEGCAVGFLDAPLRDPTARARLASFISRGETPMVLLRIGHAEPVPREPRRRLDEVLDVRESRGHPVPTHPGAQP
jgi:hypothetical protein